MLIDVLRAYADREVPLEAVIDYARTIPPRVRAEGGSPDWFDGPISEWNDLSRAILLDYVTEEEAREIAAAAPAEKGSPTYRRGLRFDPDRRRWFKRGICRLCGVSLVDVSAHVSGHLRDAVGKGADAIPESPGAPEDAGASLCGYGNPVAGRNLRRSCGSQGERTGDDRGTRGGLSRGPRGRDGLQRDRDPVGRKGARCGRRSRREPPTGSCARPSMRTSGS